MKIFLVFFGLITVCWSMAPSTNLNVKNTESDTTKYRLNENIESVRYDIEITPYLDDTRPDKKTIFTFDGSSRIKFKPLEDKSTVRLHSRLLNIIEVQITPFGVNKDQPINVTFEYETSFETILLTFSENLLKDFTYELEFIYTGEMGTDMRGFYRSVYVENNKMEWLGATQLQPTHARRVFPCFDEPHYKAKFKLTLNIPTAYMALSNTKSESIVEGENFTTYVFYETPTMSTYLLGFIVAKFQMRSDNGITANDVYKLAIYSRPDQYNLTEYPLNFGKESLNKLDKYLGLKFEEMEAMNKMDMVALPDFASGAMENWGLLTYKELYLLYDETFSTDLDKREIALTIAHEQAHQWFGNLITCDWWSNTWLNEGFATYFEFFITADVEPQWELEKTFITDTVHRALVFDSQDSTHALSDPNVNTPDEISGMFSLVSYQKGGSIIRMIEHYVGSANFKYGLHNYLKEYSYKVSQPENLLELLKSTDLIDNNVNDIFMPWITQPGYPMVTVTMDQDRKIASITQTRFLLNKKTDNFKWSIPLTFTIDRFDNLKPGHVFKSTDESYTIEIEAHKWIIFNIQQSGFYRVQYDNVSWAKIQTALNEVDYDGIGEVNRAQIVDDLLNFGRSNDLDYNFVFEILLYLKNETNYLPWHAAFTGFTFLSSRMKTDELALFRSFILDLTQTVAAASGFEHQETDSKLDIHLRSKLIEWNCKYLRFDCIRTSNRLFQLYLNDETVRIPVDIRGPVICTALRNSNSTVYNVIWSRYRNQQIASEQIILLKAMGCLSDENTLIVHLNNIFSEHVRLQDKRSAFQATYTQYEENLQIVLDYLTKYHVDVAVALEGKATFIGYLTGLADRFTLQSQITQLRVFLALRESEYGDFKNTIQSAVNRATTNLEWNAKHIPIITTFIKDRYSDDSNNSVINKISLMTILVAAAFQWILYFNNNI